MDKVSEKQDIRRLSLAQLKEKFTEMGEKAFRAKQVYEWLWKKSATSFEEMTNLSKSLRENLNANFVINSIAVDEAQISADRTIKSAFQLYDRHLVEGVLIPADDRMTACVSSQVGCSLSCSFCATGYMDRKRNLDAGEIYDQVVTIAKQAEENYGQPLTNIVYMGMGEPLLNYKNVWESIEKITSEEGLNMSPRRITVSTAGVAKMITKLADDGAKFRLALSLHAPTDEKRNRIMPINETNNLAVLIDAMKYWYKVTKSRITFEYIVFNDFNDTIEDARNLLKICRKVPSKVNIIEYNPIKEADFINADGDKIDKFANFLEKNDITVMVRRSRGKDIDAACGQLANRKN
ncbi:putative dual-specificity RNA methyltransferase RlmN [Persicobacter psychrovividus]|uniref:Probable dual-specificity RNA methyltransferase RlmN n=2 Tax=Persicobacter psychrovividus TaxID=387638 RepID=A0ABN6L9H9_9BACT|nr:putative dual-specificity RNA methyltransferase RlmN [Persicobacter psychrovividus]